MVIAKIVTSADCDVEASDGNKDAWPSKI